jgi:hypothetical protein
MKKITYALLMTLIFCLLIIPASADDVMAPYPYDIEFEDQDLVFRMIPHHLGPEKSGLYVKSTGQQIYTIYGYYYNIGLYFSADKLSFAVIPHLNDFEDEGIIFYVQNNNTESPELVMYCYRVPDLMKDLNERKETGGRYTWNKYEERIYDEENSTLSIVTYDGIHYTFDIQTGNIIQSDNENENSVQKIAINSTKKMTINPVQETKITPAQKTAIISALIILTGGALALLFYIMKKYD